MQLKLTVFDATMKVRGEARLRVVWGANRWLIEQDNDRVWRSMGFGPSGTFERKDWGVAWLYDIDSKANRRAVCVMWNAPLGEIDHRNVSGLARICDPDNEEFKEGKFSWEVANPYGLMTSSVWTAINAYELSDRRKVVLAELDQVLDHKYLDGNYERCAPGLRKTDPAVVGLEVWAKDGKGKYIAVGPADMTESQKETAIANGQVKKQRSYTTCGSLPGFVGGVLKDTTRLNGTNQVITLAKAHGAWVEANGKNQPRPGDIYALLDSKNVGVSHVGVILDATGNVWTTADMGQGGGWDGKKNVKRKYNSSTIRLTGEILQGPGDRRIAGWLDLDRYPFPRLPPDHRFRFPTSY